MIKRPILVITIDYIIGIILGLYLEISIVPFFILIVIGITFVFMYFCKNDKSQDYEDDYEENYKDDYKRDYGNDYGNDCENDCEKDYKNDYENYISCSEYIEYKNCKSDKNCQNYKNYIGYINNTWPSKNNNKFKLLFVKRWVILSFIIIVISMLIIQYKEYNFRTLYNGINSDAKYVGTIVSIQSENEYYYNYVLKIKQINGESKYNNTNIALRVKKEQHSKYEGLEYGNLIVGIGAFEKPAIRRNFKGYDQSQYLKSTNVYAICKSDIDNIQVVKENALFIVNIWIHKLNTLLKSNLYSLLPKELANIAVAFLLGDSSLIESNQRNVFSDASLSHILAISGMHVTYVVLGCSFFIKKLDKRKSKYFLIMFLIFFAELTGGSPSVIRAVIMNVIIITSKLVYRKSDTVNNISIACFIILIINPYNILNLGFQLSFLGTLGMVLFNLKISAFFEEYLGFLYGNKLLKKIMSIIILSISANILIFPIIVYNFNTTSFVFLISNILVTPILGIMFLSGYIVLLFSIISVKFANFFIFPLHICLKLFYLIAEFSSNISFMRFLVVTPSICEIAVYFIVIFYLFYFYNKKHNKNIIKILLCLIIIVFMVNFINLYNCGLKLYFIDVGQGDSTLIITDNNKKILIDGGGSETGSYDVGEKVLVPYLLDRKIMTIDYMMFSHFDADHAQACVRVIEKLNVLNIILTEQVIESDLYKQITTLAKRKNIRLIYVKIGDKINIGDVQITILHPQNELIKNNPMNSNSIVCRLEYNAFSMLFTGDIEEETEKLILSKNINLKADILKVAHHGSKTSSTMEFLNVVKPKIALIGVGEKNKYGHPSMEVMERLEYIRTKIFRTDENGEISILVNKKGRIVTVKKSV